MRHRRMGSYTREPKRCACSLGEDSHELHHRPKNMTGLHMSRKCRHSEMLNALVLYPEKIKARQEFLAKRDNRNKGKPIARVVMV